MKKLIAWFAASGRYKHVMGGTAIGLLSNTNYCAAISGVGIAAALEYKDKAHGEAWDWIDLSLTIAGAFLGRAIRYALCGK